jgi:GTPases
MFFEVSEGGERAILCSVTLREPWYVPDHEEFRSLAESAGAVVVAEVRAQRYRPSPANFVGAGKG